MRQIASHIHQSGQGWDSQDHLHSRNRDRGVQEVTEEGQVRWQVEAAVAVMPRGSEYTMDRAWQLQCGSKTVYERGSRCDIYGGAIPQSSESSSILTAMMAQEKVWSRAVESCPARMMAYV
jgi:hypothetical protein